eukprot:bmy_09258T0
MVPERRMLRAKDGRAEGQVLLTSCIDAPVPGRPFLFLTYFSESPQSAVPGKRWFPGDLPPFNWGDLRPGTLGGEELGSWCCDFLDGRWDQLCRRIKVDSIAMLSEYALLSQFTETVSPSVLPAAALPLDLLNNAVTAFSTLEDLIRYLEPDRWQLDLEDLYRPTWQLLGKAFVFGRKSRVLGLNLLKEEVRLYSCTPRNFSVSIREELKRTDTVFWPGCLLVKRCGGNCACCLHTCSECQCVPSKVTKKYHEVLQLRPKTGVRGLHKSLTDVALEHHEECDCVCRGSPGG